MATFVVDSTADTIADDGVTTLREAIMMANADADSDLIVMNLPGLTPTINLTGGPLIITEDLTISSDVFDVGAARVTIDADPFPGLPGNQATGRVFEVAGFVSASFDDLIIQNGMSAEGSGIFAEPGSEIGVFGTDFLNNIATGSGGAINSDGGSVEIFESLFVGNEASGGRGGAIFSSMGIDITDSGFFGNIARDDGGAVSTVSSDVIIVNSSFGWNSAISGGALLLQGGGSIDGGDFFSNWATGDQFSGVGGGALLVIGGKATVTDSHFAHNWSGNFGGGAAARFGGNATFENTQFHNNMSDLDGGGVYIDSGTLEFIESLLSGNMAGFNGGGAYSGTGTVIFDMSIAAFNKAVNEGGGINVGRVTSTNSILLGNMDASGGNDLWLFDDIDQSTFNGENLAGFLDGFGMLTPVPAGLILGQSALEVFGNNDPVAMDDVDTVESLKFVDIDVTVNDDDIDGHAVFVSNILEDPMHGTATFGPLGTIRYEATEVGFSGTDTFVYTVTDLFGGFDTATVTVTVTPVNQPPVAQDGIEAITDEDTDISVEVVAPASDPEGDPITLVNASIVSGEGSVSINGTQIEYSPLGIFFDAYDHLAPGDSEVVQIEYTIEAIGGTDTSTIFVTVTGVNDPPVADDDEAVTDEDTSILIDALDGDTDVDGGPLTILSADINVANKGEALVENNLIRFNPGDDFQGLQAGGSEEVEIVYQISDSFGGFDTATVTLTVNGINDAPIANPDSARTMPDTPVVIRVLDNDTDVDGGAPMLIDAFPPTSGTVVANGDGTVTYTPAPGFTGFATFEYRMGDGNGGMADAAVTVEVSANQPPVAEDDMVMTNEDTALTISIASLLNNDSDPDGDTVSFVDFTYIDLGPDLDGSMARVGNNLIYTPDPNYNGDDFFTYRISDGNGGTDTALVEITVKAVNDKPVAVNDLFITDEDTAITLSFDDLLANDTDVDFPAPADPTVFLNITAVGGATRGFVTVNFVAETIIYKPNANFNGADSFTYTIQDTGDPLPSEMDIGVVNITVDPVNDPPFIIPPQLQLFTFAEVPVSYLVTAGDVDGDALTITADGEMNGTLTASPELGLGGVTYTPDAGFQGTDGFAVQVTDVAGATATQQVTVTVGELPDADDFIAYLSDGFVGGFGGNGQVVGNAGFQDVTIFDVPGLIALDASFSRGGDILRMPGLASDWFVYRQGSSALATDGDTFVLIPVGVNGLAIAFDNFNLNLVFNQTEDTFKIGEQAFGSDMFVQITAIEELASLPTGGDPAAPALLFMAEAASITLSGRVDAFGTQQGEMFSLMGGNITIDPSANSGGDNFIIPDMAIDGTGQRSGSSFFFDGPTTDLLIPVGLQPSFLQFPGGTRALMIDQDSGMISLAGQLFGSSPEALMVIA